MKRVGFLTVCTAAALGLGFSESSAQTGREHELHPLADPAPLPLPARPSGRSGGVFASDGGFRIQLPVDSVQQSATVRLVPEKGTWDVSGKLWVLADVENRGSDSVLVRAAVRDASSPVWALNKGAAAVPPGEKRTLPVLILRRVDSVDEERMVSAFGEAKGIPGGHHHTKWRQIHADRLDSLELTFFTGGRSVECVVSNLRGAADFIIPDAKQIEERYTLLMDRFGQEPVCGWPEKIGSNEDFEKRRSAEETWLAENPPLEDRDPYGGWTGGPTLEKTGHFYTAKLNGKWWMVTPEGHLFWSFGPTGVNPGIESTKTPGLQRIIQSAPEEDRAAGAFSDAKGDVWSPYQANLRRKFGTDWFSASADLAHRRLHAWGMNTVANWSSPEVYMLRRTPYVTAIHYQRATLHGGNAMYGEEIPDVFHPEFEEKTFRRMEEEKGKTAEDPWCIGYFIDNELRFADPDTPAVEALKASKKSHSRRVFIEQLQERYRTIGQLNEAWASRFEKWDELAQVAARAGTDAYREDLRLFSERYLREYFRVCRDAVRQAAPNKLYLGSRINHYRNKMSLAICAEYADAVSINLYDYSPYECRMPDGMDKPVLIGEYHFGTLTERGVWGAGLASGMDVEHAAGLFRAYTADALRHPLIIGAHWFKFSDQPLTGRFDGENYRIGFVDIADTPYDDMIGTARDIATEMYPLRFQTP